MARTGMDILTRIAAWPTGPIFGKELRVASRRRRHFVLRAVYVLVLSAFTLLVWVSQVGTDTPANMGTTISRMSEAAKPTVASVAWFQFCVVQLLAAVLLSTSVSGEIRARTLGVLMTTPIRPLQIVLGKLFSKLLQVGLLLLLSVPVLAMIRLFGGVPWGFVLCTVCITLTASMMAGAVSMLFSILFRRPFAAILLTLATGLLIYAVLPAIMGLIFSLAFDNGRSSGAQVVESVMIAVLHVNPIWMHGVATIGMMSPGSVGGMPFFSWPLHCALMVALTGVVVFFCTVLVRRAGLRQAAGGASKAEAAAPPPLPGPGGAPAAPAGGRRAAGRVRRIHGSPVLWKELRTPLTRSLVARIVGILVPLSILAVLYLLIGLTDGLDEWEMHAVFLCSLLVIGMVVTAVMAATPITGEKESQSWELLLATPLTSGRILWGKFAGVVVRIWPAWVLLAMHAIVFSVAGMLNPLLVAVVVLEGIGATVFLTGSGMLFGSLFRRTTVAVALNLALAIVLWAVLPVVLAFVSPIVGSDAPVDAAWHTNPVTLTWEMTRDCWIHKETLWRSRTTWGAAGLPFNLVVVSVLMLAYATVGLCLGGLAQLAVRRRTF